MLEANVRRPSVRCSFCGSLFNDGSLVSSDEQMFRRVRNNLLQWVFGGFSIYALIGALFLIDTIKSVSDRVTGAIETTITHQISEQFKEPNIRKTVTEVAQTQARELLLRQIQPEVSRLKEETTHALRGFQGALNDLEANYRESYKHIGSEVTAARSLTSSLEAEFKKLAKYNADAAELTKSLSKAVDKLEKHQRILDLGNTAALEGDRRALNELSNLADSSKEESGIKKAAAAELLRVKISWLSGTRISGITLVHKTPSGVVRKEDELTTCDILQELNVNPNWKVRAKAAEVLRDQKHKKKGVPEALLRAIRGDPHLNVVKAAVESWQVVTGFQSPDIFGIPYIPDWWKQHQSDLASSLVELQCQ